MVDSNNSFEGVDYMIPANDDAMSSIDLFLKTVSNIILESKPKKLSNSEADNDQKKSWKNFILSSEISSRKLDNFRKIILKEYF